MKGSLDKDDILMMNVVFTNVGGELPTKIKTMTEEIMEEDKHPAVRKA